MMAFKGKAANELLTIEEVARFNAYAGVLSDDTILVDIDTEEETAILLNIVKSKNLKCKVLKSRSGGHFLFKIDRPLPNRTRVKLAIGITADIKGTGAASYEVLKIDGKEREVLYDTGEYQLLPKYLYPIKTNMSVVDLAEGEGRNNALFSYILPLQQNEFTVDECRECIRVINEFVLKDSLSEEELSVILRDGAFEKPSFFNNRGGFLFDKFAKYLKQAENIIKINGKLYIYRDGIYESGDD
jgi:putative DNA primase/helicase